MIHRNVPVTDTAEKGHRDGHVTSALTVVTLNYCSNSPSLQCCSTAGPDSAHHLTCHVTLGLSAAPIRFGAAKLYKDYVCNQVDNHT